MNAAVFICMEELFRRNFPRIWQMRRGLRSALPGGFSLLLKLHHCSKLPEAIWWVALRVWCKCPFAVYIAGTILDVAEALLVEATVAWWGRSDPSDQSTLASRTSLPNSWVIRELWAFCCRLCFVCHYFPTLSSICRSAVKTMKPSCCFLIEPLLLVSKSDWRSEVCYLGRQWWKSS